MSTSIEERAKTSYLRSNVQGLTIASSHEVGYIQGATEQAEITKQEMIDKACKWKCRNCHSSAYNLCKDRRLKGIEDWQCLLIQEFRRAMLEE